MAGRLLDWPVGLKANFKEPLAGPRSVSAGATTSITNYVQTYALPYGLWRWKFQFPPIRSQMARRHRGWITALHGGANATRVQFCDWDGLSFAQRGIDTTSQDWIPGQPWNEGITWDNGENWQSSSPYVPVTTPAALGATEIQLDSSYWGHNLDLGDFLGFLPFHFGLYMVTERFDDGHYRIWPPLRAAITEDTLATLEPVMVMRLEGEDAANAPRGAAFADGLSVTLVEVMDADVRSYFTG